MTIDRNVKLARAFVDVADSLVADFDLVEFLSMLSERCVDLFDASEVGVLIADPAGTLHVMASSSERMRMIELFEVQREQGPCLDACRDDIQITNEVLAVNGRWPLFSSRALKNGFAMVHAFPMHLRSENLGALNMFQNIARPFDSNEVAIAQALADAATIAILQERSGRERGELAAQLQYALDARVVIEQAKGVLSERLSIDTERVFQTLRQYAQHHNVRLSEVARQVTEGELHDLGTWVIE